MYASPAWVRRVRTWLSRLMRSAPATIITVGSSWSARFVNPPSRAKIPRPDRGRAIARIPEPPRAGEILAACEQFAGTAQAGERFIAEARPRLPGGDFIAKIVQIGQAGVILLEHDARHAPPQSRRGGDFRIGMIHQHFVEKRDRLLCVVAILADFPQQHAGIGVQRVLRLKLIARTEIPLGFILIAQPIRDLPADNSTAPSRSCRSPASAPASNWRASRYFP